jgi:hypothetical protein
METRTHGSYEVAGREIVAEGADVRVTVLTLAAGQFSFGGESAASARELLDATLTVSNRL